MDAARIRSLLDKRDAIDKEITEVVNGTTAAANRKPQKCSLCSEKGHSARTCPKKENDNG